MDKTVAVFPKNSREQVRIILGEFRGRQILNIRVFWASDKETWMPSRKGLAMGVEKLPILLASLHQAAEVLGQDAPDAVHDEEEILTPAEKAALCDEFDIDMQEVENSLTD